MHPKDFKIEDFTYELPDERIAQYPLQQRDLSKLIIYKDGEIEQDIYKNISEHIVEETLLIFNQTKVIHARLLFQKNTGSTIEIFCLEPHELYADIQTAMLQKRKILWKCLVGGAAKWKTEMILNKSFSEFNLSASIIEKQNEIFIIELSWNNDMMSFAEVLSVAGNVPLPPYMTRITTEDDTERYQTIYAKEEGSVAAPTAGLHFTKDILQSFVNKNIHTNFVTLHVGAGTFKPVKSLIIGDHDMHAEWMDVTIELIENVITNLHKGIIAVGTTSLRTLESLYWMGISILNGSLPDFNYIAVKQWEPYEVKTKNILPVHALRAVTDWMIQNKHQRLLTRTQIMIAPGYEFKIIKGLITNFHQSQSTLLLLVAALIGDDWKKVYDYAMNNDFRFLSYGDGCLLYLKDKF